MTEETKEGTPWYPDMELTRPIAVVLQTMLAVVAWLAFNLVFALCWSNSHTFFQDIVVMIA